MELQGHEGGLGFERGQERCCNFKFWAPDRSCECIWTGSMFVYTSGVGWAPDTWRDYKQLTPSCVNTSFWTQRCSHCDEDDECKAVITGFALCLSPP